MTIMDTGTIDRSIYKAIKDGIGIIRRENEQELDALSEELASNLRHASPRSGGRSRHYADGWRKRTDKAGGFNVYVVYNRAKPRLTHILEKGTKERITGKGINRGRARAIPHIQPETEKIFEKLKRR